MRNYSLYILVTAALALLLIFTLVFPKYRTLDNFKKEILIREAERQSQEEHLQELLGTLEEIEEKKESIAKIESALPRDPSLPELLNFFQKAASQSGLILEEVSPKAIRSGEEEGIRNTLVNLVLKGTYFDFKNFLSLVEKSARLIEVNNISFEYSELGDLLSFELSIKVHSY